MSVVGTPTVQGSGGFTYQNVWDDALVDLKDEKNAGAYSAALQKKLVNDAVAIAWLVTAKRLPDLIQSNTQVVMAKNNPGPYSLPDDFQSPVKMLDEKGKPVDMGYREEYTISGRTRKPDGWWVEGWGPVKLFVNSLPDQAYVWPFYYIPLLARQDDLEQSVPLPPYFREALVSWVVQMAGNIQEYDTTMEIKKIDFMDSLLSDILIVNRPKFKFKVRGLGF